MPVSTPEVLADKLLDRLQAPADDTPEALRLLLLDIQNNDEKPEILAHVREKLQGLSAEQQQQVDANLQTLEARLPNFHEGLALLKEVSSLRSELQDLSTTLPPATTVTEWFRREMNDVRTDFTEGSLWKKVGYLTGAYIGYRLVKGLWNKIRSVFTSSEKKGFFGKLLDLGATAVGAVAGVVGASQLLKAFGGSKTTNETVFNSVVGPDGKPILGGLLDRRVNNPLIPDVIEDVVEPVAEGVNRGLEETKTFFGPAFDALYQHENVRAVMENKEEYDSNAEFVQAIVTAALADGLHFAFDGTTGFLSAGGELISLTGEFWTMLAGGLMDGEIDTGDLFSVYVEGFVLYATSLTALKYLTIKRIGGNASVLFEAGAWPVYVVKRTVNASTRTVGFVYELSASTSSTRLGLQRRMGALHQRRLNFGRFFRVSDEGLQLRHAFAVDQMRLLEKARSASGIDAATLRGFEVQEAKSVEHFQKYLRAFAKKNPILPDWFLQAQRLSSANGISPDFLTSAHLRDILSRTVPTSATNPVPPVNPASAPRSPGPAAEPEPVSQGTQAADEVASGVPEGHQPGPVSPGAQTAADDVASSPVTPHQAPDAPPPHGPVPHGTPSGIPPESTPTETPPPAPGPHRTAVGDGVVPETAPHAPPVEAPGWNPRIVREDGSVVDVHGRVIEPPENVGAIDDGLQVPTQTPESSPVPSIAPREVDDVLRSQEEFADLLSRSSRGVASTEGVMVFLRQAEQAGAIRLDASTMSLLEQSPNGQKILLSAVQTGNSAEVARALRAANNAARLRIGLNAVGAVGDVFAIYMAYADWQANGRRIEATDNPALKELYQDANYVYAAEGTSGVVGLSIGGYAIVQSSMAGNGLFAAASASGSLIMLPIALATISGGYYYRRLEEVTEGWLKEEKDWLQHHQGDLLNTLTVNHAGHDGSWHRYWQGAGANTNGEVAWNWLTMSSADYRDWREEGLNRVESANAGLRFDATRAYLARTAILPKKQDETSEEYTQRFAAYIQDQAGYIARVSEGSFDKQMPSVYESAELHAELRSISRSLRLQGLSQVIPVSMHSSAVNARETVDFDLASYNDLLGRYTSQTGLLNDASIGGMGVSPEQVKAAFREYKIRSSLDQVTVMSTLFFKDQERKQEAINALLQFELLNRLQHEIAAASMRIEQADFNGWGITGAEQEAKNLSRYWVSLKTRQLIRAQSDSMMTRIRNGEQVSVEDFNASLLAIKSFLQTGALEYQTDAEKGLVNSLETARSSDPSVLDYQALRSSLFLWPHALEELSRLTVGTTSHSSGETPPALTSN